MKARILLSALILIIMQITVLNENKSSAEKHDSATVEQPVAPSAIPTATETAPASGSLSVATSSSNINKYLFGFATLDIFFKKDFVPMNLLEDPYFSLIKGLKPQVLSYLDGASVDFFHLVIGDSAWLGGQGNGYNGNISDCSGQKAPFCQKFYINGKNYDFFNVYHELCKRLPCKSVSIVNIQQGTIPEAIWQVGLTKSKLVIYGTEENKGNNAQWPTKARGYTEKVNQWHDALIAKYPDMEDFADVAAVWKQNRNDIEWNDSYTPLKTYGIRAYFHERDVAPFTGNISNDTASLTEGINHTLDNWINMFNRKFPGKRIFVTQWSTAYFALGRNPYEDQFLAAEYIPRFLKKMVEYDRDHQDWVSGAVYMQLKNIMHNGRPDINYQMLSICGDIFDGSDNSKVLVIKDQPSGLIVWGVNDNGTLRLDVLNVTGREIDLPQTINVDGTDKPLKFQGKFYDAQSLNDTQLNQYNPHNGEMHPFSIATLIVR